MSSEARYICQSFCFQKHSKSEEPIPTPAFSSPHQSAGEKQETPFPCLPSSHLSAVRLTNLQTMYVTSLGLFSIKELSLVVVARGSKVLGGSLSLTHGSWKEEPDKTCLPKKSYRTEPQGQASNLRQKIPPTCVLLCFKAEKVPSIAFCYKQLNFTFTPAAGPSVHEPTPLSFITSTR